MSQEFFDLFDQLVPEFGKHATVQCELLRPVNKLANDFVENGLANWDSGYERLCAFAVRHLADGTFGSQTSAGVGTDIEHVQRYGRGEDTGYDLESAFDRLMQVSVAWGQ